MFGLHVKKMAFFTLGILQKACLVLEISPKNKELANLIVQVRENYKSSEFCKAKKATYYNVFLIEIFKSSWKSDTFILFLKSKSRLDIAVEELQLSTFAYTWLLNKPYENEVTLREQNPPLKYCQPLELLTYFEKRFRSFNTSNMGSVV